MIRYRYLGFQPTIMSRKTSWT